MSLYDLWYKLEYSNWIFTGFAFCCQQKIGQIVKSKSLDQASNNSSPENKGTEKEIKICIEPPPPPPGPLSPSATAQKSPSNSLTKFSVEAASNHGTLESTKQDFKEADSSENQSTQDIPDDDFGDFQTAG